MLGEITKNATPSFYQPKEDEAHFTFRVQKDYGIGKEILNKSWTELNNYSVIDRMNKDQRTFQSFVDESIDDPHESWKWIGTRSLARKKAFAMHSHLTAGYLVPSIIPQNGGQEGDRAMASAMGDIVQWMTNNSNYKQSFLLVTMGMLVNPVTYLEADYVETFQKIKEKTENGEYVESEILDEVLSGLNCCVWSADQILISNAYEQNMQKQRVIISTRYVEYSELEAKYGSHENWQYLKPGIRSIFNSEDGLFYDVKDEDHPNLVEEVTWENRRQDGEVCFLNGIYFGNENLEWNPIKHRDNRNAPKYDKVPFGYHRVNEHFFYYASLMNEVGWDDKLIDAMYQVTMNREFLDAEQPVMITGVDNFDTSVVFPGGVFSTPNKDAAIKQVIPPRSGTPYTALQVIEESMSEASVNETAMGNLPQASQKAFTVGLAAQNAKIILNGVKASLAESLIQFGNLEVDIAVNHFTTAEIDELTNETKYREFILQNQKVNGKLVSKKIRFDEALMGNRMSEFEKKQYGMKMLMESGYPDVKQAIISLNPMMFSKMKYLATMTVDEMNPTNSEFEKVIWERMYTLLRQDPLIDPEMLIRELLHSVRPQYVDELMAKENNQGQMNQMLASVMGGNKTPPVLPGLPSNAGLPA